MIKASVIIGTYGDYDKWRKISERAVASVPSRNDVEIFLSHEDTRAQSRNRAAARANGEWLVFLDADDELAPGFIDLIVEDEDVLQPKTIYRQPDGAGTEAFWIPPRDNFLHGNHIVIGAPVRRNVFLASGGFEEYHIAEDWALWLKLRAMGATFGKTEATYIVNVNNNGVNSQPDRGTYEEIRKRFA